MLRILAFLAFLLLAQPCAAAETPSRARASLAELFSDEDYPPEAVRNREEGTVQFRLAIGADGKPTSCAIAASSGSALLDETTCRLLMERARFEPARDEKGKPVPDSVTARIVWRLPPSEPLGPEEAALALWMNCLGGEAAKLIPGDLSADEIVRRAWAPCAPLEAAAAQRIGEPVPLDGPREEMDRYLREFITETRAALAPGDAPKLPENET